MEWAMLRQKAWQWLATCNAAPAAGERWIDRAQSVYS